MYRNASAASTAAELKAKGILVAWLLNKYAENNAPMPIPISMAIYMVAIALPLRIGWLKSIVQAKIVGELVPAAIPKTAPPKKKLKGSWAIPTYHIDAITSNVE